MKMFYLGNRVSLEAWMKVPEEVTTFYVDIEEDTLIDFRRFLPKWVENDELVQRLFTIISTNAVLINSEYKIILNNEKNAILLSIIGTQEEGGKIICKEYFMSETNTEIQLMYSNDVEKTE